MSPRSFPKKAAGHDVQDAISWHSSALLMLFVFVILGSFGLALWVLKISLMQQQLVSAVNVVASNVMVSTQATPTSAADATNAGLTGQPSGAQGLFFDFIPCAEGYVGNCGDYVLYKTVEGKKDVVIQSMKAAFGGAFLALPLRNTHDAQYLVLSPGMIYDGLAPEIKYTYLYDLATGLRTRVSLSPDANIQFSDDNLTAAYLKEEKGDYRDVIVVDLKKNVSKTVATAKFSEMFWNGTDLPLPKAVSATSVTFDVFTSSDVTHATPTLTGTRTVEFKF